MRYKIYQWSDGSGSCIHEADFASDEGVLIFAASLPPEFGYTVEEQGNGYQRMIGEPAPAPEPSEPQGMTPAELSQMIEEARLESLYQAAMKQQVKTCDSNFYGLLTAIGALSQGTGQPVPEKAGACIAWLESLWADYHTRKATGSTDCDFSSYGRCPFTFLQVRAG